MSLFSLDEQTGRADGAPTAGGRAVVRNEQNLSKPDDGATKQS
jgi:hypothetical protein